MRGFGGEVGYWWWEIGAVGKRNGRGRGVKVGERGGGLSVVGG